MKISGRAYSVFYRQLDIIMEGPSIFWLKYYIYDKVDKIIQKVGGNSRIMVLLFSNGRHWRLGTFIMTDTVI